MRCNLTLSIFIFVCALTTVTVPQMVNAAEWSLQPAMRLGRGYDDNARLTLQPHNSVTSSLFAPRVDWSVGSDIWQVAMGVEAVQNRFSGDSTLDTDDRSYKFSASYKSERSTWQITGLKSKSSILASQVVTPETGVVQTQQVYDTQTISPSWTWAMTELTQLQLAYSLGNVSYVNGMNAGLYDYSTRSVSATLTNSLSAKDQVFFTAGYSIFNVPATSPIQINSDTATTSQRSKSATYQVGITRMFSETAQGTLSAGVRKTSNEQDTMLCIMFFGPQQCFPQFHETIFNKASGTVFNGNFEKQFENNHFNVNASRSLDSSGTGWQVQTDSLRVVFDHSFASSLTGHLTYSSYVHSILRGGVAGVDNRIYYIVPALDWALTQELTLNTNYRYTHLRRVGEDKPVESNAVYLTLVYQWPKMSISR